MTQAVCWDFYVQSTERGKYHDLSEIIFCISSDWNVQFWRRLCGNASDTAPGSGHVSLVRWKGFADLVTISQMTPGPIATNAATFVGMNTAGLAGALIATFGCILPSCILVTFIAYFYLKYQKLAALQGILSSLRPAVIALIASAGISILVSAFWNGQTVIRLPDTDWGMVILFGLCIVLLRKCKMNPVTVMFLAGILKVLLAEGQKIL